MKFNDFRVPVEYIIDQYWRKKQLKDKVDLESDDLELPQYPVDLIRNEEKKVEKIIYGKDSILEWYQEIFRDYSGKVTRIKNTFPDESYLYIDIIRKNGKVVRVEVNE